MRRYSGHFNGQLSHCLHRPHPQRIYNNAPYRKILSVEHAVILIAVDTLSNTAESEKTNKLIDDPERDVC